MSGAPHLSVIIPVFNGERFIGAALRSVFAQTRAPDEIVVVDDGSTDATAQVVARFEGLTLLQQSNQGTGAARNRGLAAASGELLAFLDADDLWLPDKLARQERVLATEPRVDMVLGRVQQFRCDERGHDAEPVGPPMPGYLPTAVLVRRAACTRIGPFDTARDVPEVASWFLRVKELGLEVRVLDEVLAQRRLHSGNKGRVAPGLRQGYVRALKASLDRRRAAQRRRQGEE